MPQAEYERRLVDRGHSQRRWEVQIAEGYVPGDLDADEIRRTIREAIDAGRLDSTTVGPTEAIDKLHLIKGICVLQAAVVAFGKEVLPAYPQCGLRMARFRGVTKDEFLDQRQLTGNAFRLLEEVTVFLNRHLPVHGRFVSGVMERKDEPLFPPLALREARAMPSATETTRSSAERSALLCLMTGWRLPAPVACRLALPLRT